MRRFCPFCAFRGFRGRLSFYCRLGFGICRNGVRQAWKHIDAPLRTRNPASRGRRRWKSRFHMRFRRREQFAHGRCRRRPSAARRKPAGLGSGGACGRMSHCGGGRFFGFKHLIRQIPPIICVRRLQRNGLRHMLGKGRDAPSFGFDLHRPALPLHFSFAYSTPVKSVLCRRGGVLFLRTGVRGLFAPFSASCETSNGRAADLRFYFEKTPAHRSCILPERRALRGRIGGETIFRPFSHKKTRAAGS